VTTPDDWNGRVIAGYEQKTTRQIPVVILEPAQG
jgi:hypothetical protein